MPPADARARGPPAGRGPALIPPLVAALALGARVGVAAPAGLQYAVSDRVPEGIPAVLRVWLPDREAALLVERAVGGAVLRVQSDPLPAGHALSVSLPVVPGVSSARCALSARSPDGELERQSVELRWIVGPAAPSP